MTEIIETAGRYRLRLEIQQDSFMCNPRTEQDINLTNVITLRGQRYIDVDEDGGPLKHGWDYFQTVDEGVNLFIRWARIFHGAVAVEKRPHDGANAIWYVMPDKKAETPWPAEKIIDYETQEYEAWARGEVYSYRIEKRVTWAPKEGQDTSDIEDLDDEMATWETVESCGGYIGRENAEEAAREAFAPYKEN